MKPPLMIGQLAKHVGVNIETLRYYERLDLLSPSARNSTGYRLYGLSEIRRLYFIRNAKALGFTLQEIAEFLSLRVASTAACADVRHKTRVKLGQVEKKLVDLQALARSMRKFIRSCEAEQTAEQCPLLESLEHQEKPAETQLGNGTSDGSVLASDRDRRS